MLKILLILDKFSWRCDFIEYQKIKLIYTLISNSTKQTAERSDFVEIKFYCNETAMILQKSEFTLQQKIFAIISI